MSLMTAPAMRRGLERWRKRIPTPAAMPKTVSATVCVCAKYVEWIWGLQFRSVRAIFRIVKVNVSAPGLDDKHEGVEVCVRDVKRYLKRLYVVLSALKSHT